MAVEKNTNVDIKKELDTTKVTKPGWKTTEFAISILTTVGALTASLAGVLDPKVGAILMGLSTFAYALSRGLAKK